MLARAVALLVTFSAVGALAACSEPPPAAQEPRPVVSPPNAFDVASALPDRDTPQLVNVNFLDGQVTGDGGSVPVALGSVVRVTVVSDVADTVVVEGFDQRILTAIDQPVQLELLTTEPGSFDVKLEDSGEVLTTLDVG